MKSNLYNDMRKFLLFLFILTVIIFPLRAQSDSSRISIGAQGGGALSGFSHYRQFFTEKKAGATIGAFAEYKVFDFLGVSLELNYTMQGAANASPRLIYSMTPFGSYTWKYGSDITLHTLQIPVLLNFRPLSDGGIVPKLAIGYTTDIFIRATSRDQIYSIGSMWLPLEHRNTENVTESFKKMNHGPVIGFGLDFMNTRPRCSIEARYQVGMREINNLGGLNTINEESDFSSSTFLIYLKVYLFNL
jgi:hypothetical protein